MRTLGGTILLAAALGACAGQGRLIREEDLRATDSPTLKAAASSSDAQKRRRAYLAMGRVQSEAYVDPLLAGLSDGDAAARLQAVFSLGQLGLAEPEVSSATRARLARGLEGLAREEDAELRRKAVEALGKIGGPREEEGLISRLSDGGASVRGEAALALARLRYLKRIPAYSSATAAALITALADPRAEARWRAAYAFSRDGDSRARDALAAALSDADGRVRLFALRGLGRLKDAGPSREAARSQSDSEALVRLEAVRTLGASERADLLIPAVFSDSSPHVRAAAADALGIAGSSAAAGSFEALLGDRSPLVAGQALLALSARKPETALEAVETGRRDPSWWLRSKAYEAMAGLPQAWAALEEGLKDPDARVAAAALEALSKSTEAVVGDVLEGVLRDPEAPLELIGAAVAAAGQRKEARFEAPLRALLVGRLVRRYPELAGDVHGALRKVHEAHPELRTPLPRKPETPIIPAPWLGQRPAPATVVFETERGSFELALAVTEAPVHAAAFVASVRKRVYDGTIWHRIASGFVAQGGDPRGSGWGDAGFLLRDEINELRFERGTVGMPKAGKDTGGCQVFITYAPAPHLDGRYTVFGRVSSGMDVIDKLEPGDRIRRAYLKPAASTARASP